METVKFVRKPLFVDAVKVTPENFSEVVTWCGGTVTSQATNEAVPSGAVDPEQQYIHVSVHNPKNARQTRAFVGDWILYTERGYKVYTEKAFFGSFDKVEEQDTVNPNQEGMNMENNSGIPEDETPGQNAGEVETEQVREPVQDAEPTPEIPEESNLETSQPDAPVQDAEPVPADGDADQA